MPRTTADAITAIGISPNVSDSNLEPANLVDAIDALARSTRLIAAAIIPVGVAPSQDSAGTHVDSLTESVMGITAGLMDIASAIRELAEAVNDHGEKNST